MKKVAIIPARMGSTRFPGKPLALINEVPMISHVYEGVKSSAIDLVVVATCDKEIKDYVESIGGNCVLTSRSHERASERCGEALDIVERQVGCSFDITVMVQGDEPMVTPGMVEEAVRPFEVNRDTVVTNLYAQIRDESEYRDSNCIKVTIDNHSNAIAFSRSPIPYSSLGSYPKNAYKQVCIIPFRSDFLRRYVEMKPTELEIIESIDMLRILENGYKVRMVRTNEITIAVDTPIDIVRVEKLWNI